MPSSACRAAGAVTALQSGSTGTRRASFDIRSTLASASATGRLPNAPPCYHNDLTRSAPKTGPDSIFRPHQLGGTLAGLRVPTWARGRRNTGMQFGIICHHQFPRPWAEGAERKLFQEVLD